MSLSIHVFVFSIGMLFGYAAFAFLKPNRCECPVPHLTCHCRSDDGNVTAVASLGDPHFSFLPPGPGGWLYSWVGFVATIAAAAGAALKQRSAVEPRATSPELRAIEPPRRHRGVLVRA